MRHDGFGLTADEHSLLETGDLLQLDVAEGYNGLGLYLFTGVRYIAFLTLDETLRRAIGADVIWATCDELRLVMRVSDALG